MAGGSFARGISAPAELKGVLRFPQRVEDIAYAARVPATPRQRKHFIPDRDGRQVQVTIGFLGRQVGGHVVSIKPLLDRDDGACHFVVLPAQKSLIDEPLGLRSSFWIPS